MLIWCRARDDRVKSGAEEEIRIKAQKFSHLLVKTRKYQETLSLEANP